MKRITIVPSQVFSFSNKMIQVEGLEQVWHIVVTQKMSVLKS